MAKYLIARAKVLDENGKEIPVDIRTCAEAVTCSEGKTAQDHFQTLTDHIADTVAHPTQTRQAAWDAKETPSGAQAKADAAVTKANANAMTIVTQQFSKAVGVANTNAQTMANNAKTDAINAAAANTTAQLNAFASGKVFVVAHGTVDGWSFRKWSNGTIEAWCEISAQVSLSEVFALTDNSGSKVCFIRGKIPEQDIPEAIGFTAAPLIQVDLSCGNYFVWGASGTPSAINKTPAVNVMAWNAGGGAGAAINASYICIGR